MYVHTVYIFFLHDCNIIYIEMYIICTEYTQPVRPIACVHNSGGPINLWGQDPLVHVCFAQRLVALVASTSEKIWNGTWFCLKMEHPIRLRPVLNSKQFELIKQWIYFSGTMISFFLFHIFKRFTFTKSHKCEVLPRVFDNSNHTNGTNQANVGTTTKLQSNPNTQFGLPELGGPRCKLPKSTFTCVPTVTTCYNYSIWPFLHCPSLGIAFHVLEILFIFHVIVIFIRQ